MKLTIIILQIALILLTAPQIANGQSRELENYIESQFEDNSAQSILPCGFAYDLLLKQYWPQLHPDLKSALGKPFFDPPQLQDSVSSPGGKFILHFNRSGSDAVPDDDLQQNGLPDFIDSAAVILDYVWFMEVDILQYQPPLDRNANPVQTYHVYFRDLSSQLGVTHSLEEIPGPEGYYRYTSYIVLDNDYQNSNFSTKGLDGLRITAAHEFNHAIQLSTRVWWQNGEAIDIFLMEMTSSWLEDVLYDEINDYYSDLPYFFSRYSNTSFTNVEYLYPYGNCLFLHILEKQFGVGIGRDIWERVKQKPGLEAIKDALTEQNTSFPKQLHQYSIWLYHTGDRADPENFFPEGYLYPQISIKSEDIYPYQREISQQKMVTPLATRVMQIEDIPAGGYQAGAKSTRFPGYLTHLVPQNILNTVSFNQNGMLSIEDDNPINVLITNSSADSSEIVYSFGGGLDLPEDNVLAYPNPVIFSEQEELSFKNIPEEGKIHIFNSNGEKIVQLEAIEENTTVVWDLKDASERSVSSGTFLYLFKGANTEQKGKFVIIR
jgi:hypothetical protein